MNTIWTLFVLDYDGTYDLERHDEDGVQPTVYLVPEDKVMEVKKAAEMSGTRFANDEIEELCIGDYFELEMKLRDIPCKVVGHIDLTFGERQRDYLADYIPREIV